jgi:ABC-2 type transport system ATP-binding protein
MLVDATDRSSLRSELERAGVRIAIEDGGFKVYVQGAHVHELLKRIETPLTLVRTRAPTLEDVYLEIVGRGE